MDLMTNLGFPLTTSTVTATPLSRSSTQGPAFSIQTSITLNSELVLLKFLLPPRSLFTDFCQLTVSSSGLRSSLYNPICVYRVPQRYPMTQSQIKLLRMYPRLCCLQLTQVQSAANVPPYPKPDSNYSGCILVFFAFNFLR